MTSASAATITLITTLVTAATTVTLAVLTAKYVKLTGRMADEMRDAKNPAVFVELAMRHGGHELLLILGNSGLTPAHEIRITYSDTVSWSAFGRNGTAAASVLKDGLAYLAPGRVLRYTLGFFEWPKEGEANGTLSLAVEYRTAQGVALRTSATFRLNDYRGLKADTFDAPEQAIVTAIERATAPDFSEQLGRFTTKFCPMCAETIPRAAKKCARCGEMIAGKSEGGDAPSRDAS